MALGDYEKTTYVNGSAPGLSAQNLNKNENKTEELDNALATHLAEETQQAHLAKNIGLEDTAENFTATELEGALAELFINVSNGKNMVSGAITDIDDSVVIPANPSFEDLINAIGQINTGRKWASGATVTPKTGNEFRITGLDFTPTIAIAKVTTANYNNAFMSLAIIPFLNTGTKITVNSTWASSPSIYTESRNKIEGNSFTLYFQATFADNYPIAWLALE